MINPTPFIVSIYFVNIYTNEVFTVVFAGLFVDYIEDVCNILINYIEILKKLNIK